MSQHHFTQIKGDEIQGFWFECSCGKEGKLYDDQAPAEMEAAVHEIAKIL